MKINQIYLNQNLDTQEEVFEFLSQAMFKLKIVDNPIVYLNALHERESQSSTGLVDGFAIPHGKSNEIKQAAVIYLRNSKGIEWESLDGSLITDIFALAIPSFSESEQLDTLIALSTQLMDPEVCQRLRLTEDEEEILNIFA